MPLWWPLLLASLLFAIGVYGVLVRRNAVLVLMGVELMLNAVNLNLVAFDTHFRDVLHGGQTFALFIIVIAAAEIGLALAIVLNVPAGVDVRKVDLSIELQILAYHEQRKALAFDGAVDIVEPPVDPRVVVSACASSSSVSPTAPHRCPCSSSSRSTRTVWPS